MSDGDYGVKVIMDSLFHKKAIDRLKHSVH